MRQEIGDVVELMRDRYHEDLTLEELATAVNLTPGYLSRLFCRETGYPPTRFLGGVRLEVARQKLLCTEESVADIAVQVGCASLGTFTSRFTRTVGISPGRYRRAARLGNAADGFAGEHDDLPCTQGSILVSLRSAALSPARDFVVRAVPTSLVLGGPVEPCAVEDHNGSSHIAHVTPGRWMITVRTHGESGGTPVLAAILGPVHVVPGAAVPVELDLERLLEGTIPHCAGPLPDRVRKGPRARSDFSRSMGVHGLACRGPATEAAAVRQPS
ncbi:AraC family transcriptional regulator [Spirillospora sp. NPDC048832]